MRLPHPARACRLILAAFLGITATVTATLPATALAATSTLPKPVRVALAKERLKSSDFGVWIQAVDSSKPMIVHHGNKLFNPASVMKLVTSIAALDMLGRSFTWPTKIYADHLPVNGVIKGNLYLKGFGDPWFRSEDLWNLVRDLHDLGVEEITGNLVIDNSYFAPSQIDPGDFDNRPDRLYNALPQALLLDNHATRISIVPSDDSNRGAHIEAWPPNPKVKVRNDLNVTDKPCTRHYNRAQLSIDGDDGAGVPDTIAMRGRYSLQCGPGNFYRVVGDANTALFYAFKRLFAEQGGKVDGHLALGEVPDGATYMTQHRSRSLTQYLWLQNKWSNNVMARQIFLTIGAEVKGPPATPLKGRAAVNQWLKGLHMDFKGFDVENGAGLSRKSRISPHQVAQLLLYAWNSPFMPELMSSLPVAGIDGTMRKRLKDEPAQGHAHIKTGTLKNVRAGAGYLISRSGRRYVVVMIQNETGVQNGGGTVVQNALLEWLYQNG